jgi:CTP:molybdopterin cytidylyltransferase MocA
VSIAGIVLAAGAGSRAGGPKALRREPDGRSWVEIAVLALADAGCEPVVVVLGAEAERAVTMVPQGATPVVNREWEQGQSTSLRAGLESVGQVDGVMITVVDRPTQTTRTATAVMAAAEAAGTANALVRPVIDGQPGHPVYVGSARLAGLKNSLGGDAGAREYLASNADALIEVLVPTVQPG